MAIDLTKSPLTEEEKREKPKLDFTPKEITYMGNLQKRLTLAKNQRDTTHDFFDGMTYIQRCEQNRQLANARIRPKSNKNETAFTTGTARQKLMSLLAAINNLNLKADITAFDENDKMISDLGEGMEDIIEKTEEIDGDEEKRLQRQYTLNSQGEVFVEEVWSEKFKTDKDIPKFDGKFKGVKWNSRLKKVFAKASRNVIRNEKVYLGDITEPDIKKQPFLFTLEITPYETAKSVYGKWENWKHVSENVVHAAQTQDHETTMYNPYWTLTTASRGRVEVIKYQDPINNEFQIILNGIPMLPIGFPLPWKHDGVNLVHQILELIDSHFAYGKSLMQRVKTSAALEDEFWRLVLLKGHTSLRPPMANMTGRVLSSKILMPGRMNIGVDPSKLKPLIESEGPTISEFNILKMLRDNIDEHSVSPTFQGQTPERKATATEIIEVQKQAQLMLGLTVFACAMLEKKLAELRIFTILEKWFDPVDTRLDEIKGGLKDIYRRSTLSKPIEGEGMGQQIVEVVPNAEAIPSPFMQLKEEEQISKETGIPTRILRMNKEQIMKTKLIWRITVNPTPKKTSNLQKLMFREMIDAFSFSPNLSLDWAEEKAALVWGENPSKVFKKENVVAGGIVPPSGATPLGREATKVNRTPNATPNAMANEAA